MSDIYLGLLIIALLAASLFAAGRRLSRTVGKRTAGILALGALVILGVLFAVVNDRLFLAQLLPFSNALVLGNWVPLVGAFLAGLAGGRPALPLWRRLAPMCALVAVSLYALLSGLAAETPATADVWTADGVCMQTSRATCSAAVAATVLRHHGVESTEEEMVRLCLTTEGGTTSLGLFRGLKIKTRGTPWDVRVVRTDVAGLRAMSDSPVILFVGLARGADADPRYEAQWGWRPGRRHTVILYGFAEGDMVDIADPDVGREQWRLEGIETLWHGEGLRLVERGG